MTEITPTTANISCKQDTARSVFLELGEPRVTCADCLNYPLGSASRFDWCYSRRKYVGAMDDACDRQNKKKRPQGAGLAKYKINYYRDRLNDLNVRLGAFAKTPRIFWKAKTEALQSLSGSLREIKKTLDEEQRNPGKHAQWRQLRNHKRMMLYIVECLEYTKIGFTASPVWRRMTQIRNANPVPFRLIALIPGDQAKESLFHRSFSAWSHRPEWFKLPAEAKIALLAMIQEHGGKMVDPPIEYG